MKNETRVTTSIKIEKTSHRCDVIIDWTGMTDDDLQALAQRSIIIRMQNAARVTGKAPEEEMTIRAVDYRIGVRTSRPVVLSPEQMLASLSPEERAALIAKFLNS